MTPEMAQPRLSHKPGFRLSHKPALKRERQTYTVNEEAWDEHCGYGPMTAAVDRSNEMEVRGMGLIAFIKGFPGKPSHPPLTDVAIGGYTVGVIVLVLGALDFQESQMAHGALLAISGGIIFGLLAAVTGLLDWWALPGGTPVRRLATAHLLVMVTATGLFVATWLLQRPGYNHGEVKTAAWIVGLVGELVLIAGGYLGGAIVFVYGTRVLGLSETPVADALVPGRVEAGRPQAGARDGHVPPSGQPQPPPSGGQVPR